ncbi:MAG: hypothetical protein Q4D38_10455 [Planctomycetia bacterium]|nr:hypothetical protein [Planctomycetia bacterium]
MRNLIPTLLSILFLLVVSVPAWGESPDQQTIFLNWYIGDDEERQELTVEEMKLKNVEGAFARGHIDDLDLLELKYFPNLKSISFYHAKVTDEGILTLADLKVERIWFDSCENLTYAGVHALQERMPSCTIVVKNLQHMDLAQCGTKLVIPKGVRDSDLSALAYFPRVEEVLFMDVSSLSPNALVFPPEFAGRLKSFKLSQSSLTKLPELPALLRKLEKLETLYLEHVPVTTELLEAVADMPNLKNVTIRFFGKCQPPRPGALAGWRSRDVHSLILVTGFTNPIWTMIPADLTFLAPLQKLKKLELPTVKLDLETSQMLSRLKNLRHLALAPDKNVDVENLAHLKQLRLLLLISTPFSEPIREWELAPLRQRLPGCRVCNYTFDYSLFRAWLTGNPPVRGGSGAAKSSSHTPRGTYTFRMFSFEERPKNEAELEAFLTKELERRRQQSEAEKTAAPYPISWLTLDLRPVGDLVSDETLQFLVRQSPLLEALHVQSKNVTTAGLASIAQLKNLECLTLRNASITDESLRVLAGHPQLDSLSLDGNPLTDAGLKILEEVPHLELLTLRGGHFTDVGMESIGRMLGLKRLCLGTQPDVTEAGIEILRKLPNLEPESDVSPRHHWIDR